MRRIKEVLRLKQVSGLSDSAVSRSARIARSTVKEYLDRAARAGLNWAVAEGLSEEEVERRLFAAAAVRDRRRPVPDWEVIEQELRGRGVTLRLLWLEYLSRHPGVTPSSASISTLGSSARGRRGCASRITPARLSRLIGLA